MRKTLLHLVVALVTFGTGVCVFAWTVWQSGNAVEPIEVASVSVRTSVQNTWHDSSDREQILESSVDRYSDQQNSHGHFLPPWTRAEIAMSFSQEPKIGTSVTVVPVDVSLASFDLKIVKTEKQSGGFCDEQDVQTWWDIEFASLPREILSIPAIPNRREEHPFDVVVIYPSVVWADQLHQNQLAKQDLPRGVYLRTVKAAIDLTKDGSPDILTTHYCCGEPSKKPEECDYTCTKTYRKLGTAWKLINSTGPC